MRCIANSALFMVALIWLAGCSLAPVQDGPETSGSPLVLEVFSGNTEVHGGNVVSLHARLRNSGSMPVQNITIAIDCGRDLAPLGAIGSTESRLEGPALHIEPVLALQPKETAEWWVAFRARPGEDIRARVMAVTNSIQDGNYQYVQWRVGDDSADRAEGEPYATPAAMIHELLGMSDHSRDTNDPRGELFALYSARILMNSASSQDFNDIERADVIDRARAAYAQVYGIPPRPMIQDRLPHTSMLTGIVVDRLSQLPVSGATVELRTTLTGTLYATTVTGADGTFQFGKLGAEMMSLVISTPGYQTVTRSGFELRQEAITRLIAELDPPLPNEFAEIGGVRDLAELHGTLTGYRGDGTVGVQVILAGTDTLEALTDDQGQFRFSEVAPGDYTFVAVKPGFSTIERRSVRVKPGGVVEMQFTLEPDP